MEGWGLGPFLHRGGHIPPEKKKPPDGAVPLRQPASQIASAKITCLNDERFNGVPS